MGGRHTVDLLGAKGVNVVKTPLEMDDSELTSGQNAQFYREQGVAGLRDRSGLPTHSLSSMGASANGGIGLPLPAPGAAGGSPLYVARTASPGYTISGSFAFASKPTPSTGANDVRAFVYAPGLRRWVAVGDGGLVLTSDDGGLTWTTRVAAEANGWRDVAWNGQTFVAVAGGGTHRVMLSYDGVVWFAQTAAEANGWQGVCWSDALNLWCAVANSGVHRVMTSPDGISWSAQTAAAAKQWLGVAWSPELSLFAAVSLDATTCIQTSPDGVTWTSRTTGTNVHSGGPSSGNSTIVWSSEIRLFAFPSFNGTTWFATTSTDGVTWTDQTLANQVGNSGIVAVAGLLVIMQELGGGGATNPYMFSSNGSSWTQGDTGVSKTWLCAGGAVEGATAMIVAWDNNLSSRIPGSSGSNPRTSA
jgi:hypothetical protein